MEKDVCRLQCPWFGGSLSTLVYPNSACASWRRTSWTSRKLFYGLWRKYRCFFKQRRTSRYADYLPSTDSSNHKMTQGELNDLIRDLELPKNKAELLASRLQQWNFLHHSVKVTTFRTRNKELEQFFKTEGDFTYCLMWRVVHSLACVKNYPGSVSKKWKQACSSVHKSGNFLKTISLKLVLSDNEKAA